MDDDAPALPVDPLADPLGPPWVGEQLTRTAKAVSGAFDAALVAAGGSLPVFLVLDRIHADDLHTQREIAASMGVQAATLTHHLNALEADGLVTRTRREGDRRSHAVGVTPAGEELFQRLAAVASGLDGRLRAAVGGDDLHQLHELLARLRAAVAPPPPDAPPA